jgi:hypothetical protein
LGFGRQGLVRRGWSGIGGLDGRFGWLLQVSDPCVGITSARDGGRLGTGLLGANQQHRHTGIEVKHEDV